MMNRFHDFDDFRVSAWMDEGLLIRLGEMGKTVTSTVTKAVAYAVVATAFVGGSVSATIAKDFVEPIAMATQSYEETLSLQDELGLMSVCIEDKLQCLDRATTSSVNSELLSLARLAIAASLERQDKSPKEIAEAFFYNLN